MKTHPCLSQRFACSTVSVLAAGLLTTGPALIPAAGAATAVYTDPASFTAALASGYYQESFDSLSLGEGPSSYSFNQGGLSYVAATADGSDFFNVALASDVYLSTANSGTDVVFSLAGSSAIHAVGGYFFLTDLSGAVAPGDTTITLNDGTSRTLTNAGATSFLGFISTDALSTLTFVQPDGTAFATVNDFIVGQAAVPEPSTYAFAAMGFGVLLLAQHRRRQALAA